MGTRIDILKSFPDGVQAHFEEVGLYKALRAKIVFSTLKEKMFLFYMAAVSFAATGYVAVKIIAWII